MFGFGKLRRTYMDYAGGTPLRPEARKAIEDAALLYGNPGALHEEGRHAARSIGDSRSAIARELGVKAHELVFVSGGTEANNLAILGLWKRMAQPGGGAKGTHWIVSAIEHPSVLACFDHIGEMGGAVERVMPDSDGSISPESVEALLRPETALVSVGWGNHEVGVVQPLRAIAQRIARFNDRHGSSIALHADAGQAPLYLSAKAHTLGVDMLSLDSSKLYGPRGVGALFVSDTMRSESGSALAPLLLGGGQERGMRAGSEPVALAAGFAAALTAASGERGMEAKRLEELRVSLMRTIMEEVPGAVVNGAGAKGARTPSLPHILNISIPDISSEYVVLALDRRGVSVSTKSACREGEESRSHVVEAMFPHAETWRAASTVRFSLGRDTSPADVRRTTAALRDAVEAYRAL